MHKIFGILLIILVIGLSPPATLALISNNAVRGDATYPIKRLLEDGIFAVASLTPTTKAWFSAARSDRRFEELSTLIAQGKQASNTLDELVIQTDIAAEEIKKVEDPVRKQELIAQLLQSIDKYSQKLDEVSITTPIPTPTPILPVVSPAPDVTSPGPKASPRLVPPGSTLTPQPKETPRPAAPSPTPTITPSPSSPKPPVDQEEIDEAKEKLEDIKDKLKKEEKKSQPEKREDKREDRKDERSEKDNEKRNKDSDHDKKQD